MATFGGTERERLQNAMTLIRGLIDIPTQVRDGDFVLKLTEGVGDDAAAATVGSYEVIPQLAGAFDAALSKIAGASPPVVGGALPARQLQVGEVALHGRPPHAVYSGESGRHAALRRRPGQPPREGSKRGLTGSECSGIGAAHRPAVGGKRSGLEPGRCGRAGRGRSPRPSPPGSQSPPLP